jgi:dihydrodipicolinate synthase/N-acetylneuraminate lyase
MSSSNSFAGIYPALCTPFDEGDAVDLPAQKRLVRFAIDSGAHGLVAFGLAGEVHRLSVPERKALTDAILEETGGAVPVFVGAGAESVAAAIDLAKYAEDAGAAAVVLPAPAGVTSSAAVVDYFARVAASVALPVAIQDAPAYLGIELGPQTVESAITKAPNISIVKVEAGPSELSRWVSTLGEDVSVWGGDGGVYLLDAIQVGAAGVIPGLDLVDVLVRVYELDRRGERAEAEALFARALPMLVFEMQHSIDHYNACAKRVLKFRGLLDHTLVRSPATSLPAPSVVLLEQHLTSLDLVAVPS